MIDSRQRNTALLVAGCFFMENLDATIVTTAAPRIGQALGVPSTSVGLVIAAYTLTVAALIPLSGWLTARLGARVVFLTAIAVFTIASLGCALSTTFGELVAFRVLQGAGGAMMVPVGRLVVVSRTEKSDLIRVTAWIVWPALIAPVIAPLAGALIVTYADWPWLFLINLPLGAIALVVAHRLIESGQREARPLDGRGVVLTCGGLAAATYAAYLLSQTTVVWSRAVIVSVVAAIMLAAAIVHLRRAANPLLDLSPLKVETFRQTLSSGPLFMMAVTAVPFLLALLFQLGFGWSPVKSSILIMFVFAGNIAIKPATTPLLHRFGFRGVLLAATSATAATMVAIGLVVASTPVVAIAVIVLLSGAGRSTGLTCYATMVFSDTPPDQMRSANTLQATLQQLAVGLGAPLAMLAVRASRPIETLLTNGKTSHAPYSIAFGILAVVTLVATGTASRLHPHAGAHVTRHTQRV